MLGKVGEIYSRFNPRTYIRYDELSHNLSILNKVSIHVPI